MLLIYPERSIGGTFTKIKTPDKTGDSDDDFPKKTLTVMVLKILIITFLIIQTLFALYLIIPFILLVAVGLKSIIRKTARHLKNEHHNYHFAAIITAHKDSRFIPPLVDSLLRQTYLWFNIYVVADQCDLTRISFNDPRVIILTPDQPLNAKTKSIQYAINNFRQQHDALIIFDVDNLVHQNFMQEMNHFFNNGFKMVQGNIKAKNLDTIYSRLDALSDTYNNFIDRKSQNILGLSSHIDGKGIAIATDLYTSLKFTDGLGGFDKKMQADLVTKVHRIGFAKKAVVYDEKIADGETLETQRTRWIFTYFRYLNVGWDVLKTGLRRFNFNLIYFGYNLVRPPLFILLFTAGFFLLFDLLINPIFSVIWISIILIFFISFFAIIFIYAEDHRITKSIFHIPKFVYRQVMALMKIRKANKSFLKTEHKQVLYIKDVLK